MVFQNKLKKKLIKRNYYQHHFQIQILKKILLVIPILIKMKLMNKMR